MFGSDLPAQGTVTGVSRLVGQTVRDDQIKILPCHEPCDHFLLLVKKGESASDQTTGASFTRLTSDGKGLLIFQKCQF